MSPSLRSVGRIEHTALYAAAPRGDCADTDSEFARWEVIICAVLAGSRLRLHSAFAALRSGCRSSAGAQIITLGTSVGLVPETEHPFTAKFWYNIGDTAS
jgi:hypothetical protein